MKFSEISRVETARTPGALADVLSTIAATGSVFDRDAMLLVATRSPADATPACQLLPDPLDVRVHERISRASANGSIGAKANRVLRPSDTERPQPEAT